MIACRRILDSLARHLASSPIVRERRQAAHLAPHATNPRENLGFDVVQEERVPREMPLTPQRRCEDTPSVGGAGGELKGGKARLALFWPGWHLFHSQWGTRPWHTCNLILRPILDNLESYLLLRRRTKPGSRRPETGSKGCQRETEQNRGPSLDERHRCGGALVIGHAHISGVRPYSRV